MNERPLTRVEKLIVQAIRNVGKRDLGLEYAVIRPDLPLTAMGFDSVSLVDLSMEIEHQLKDKIDVDPYDLYNAKSLDEVFEMFKRVS